MKNKPFLKGALCGALAVLLIIGLVSCGRQLSTRGTEEKLTLLKALIDEKFLRDADEDKLTEGIYKGYVGGLDDPYSAYYDAKETKQLQESTLGEYKGIGATMSQDKDTGIITIVRVNPESPAMEAGIVAEDVLYKVDEEEVTGEDLSQVVSKIKGEEGTTVDITVLRGEQKEEKTMPVTRRTITVETVMHELKAGQIGYIRILEFDAVTRAQYEEALADLQSQNMKGLVVDLRSNPGGNLDTVCEILDLMIPKGVLVYTEDKDGNKEEKMSDEEHQFNLPMTVLVNEYSASASEIFAGAVQDYEKGKVIGMQTYGKGVVQQILDLQDGTSVKLTIAEYFTPKGRNIDGVGITPDEVVEYIHDENNPQSDNQLEKAVEVLNEEIQPE